MRDTPTPCALEDSFCERLVGCGFKSQKVKYARNGAESLFARAESPRILFCPPDLPGHILTRDSLPIALRNSIFSPDKKIVCAFRRGYDHVVYEDYGRASPCLCEVGVGGMPPTASYHATLSQSLLLYLVSMSPLGQDKAIH